MMMETLPSGTVLNGRYRIERVLGSGGFGHVYLAMDLQNNQQYAVKEYFVTGSSGQAQLQHEARVLSQLHHPNLPAFQAAFNERGHYFVVLSYIEGNDLTDLIRVARQRNEIIPLDRVVEWLLSVCDAVQFLHAQQPPVIHRDIKPDNIRITPNGTAILVDLGNAKATADGSRTLFFIRHQGTPGYAPQEQYPGGSGTDVRSDVYALGGTLYFALTAHEPPSVSTRNQALQQGQPDLPSLQEQLAHNPPAESADPNRQFRVGGPKPAKPAPRHIRHLAQLGTLAPELLEQLNRIIKRAMAMKQKDRYPSVADFRHDLKKVKDALPVPPSPRPLDPNSTQPDLPMLYEALEAAKNDPPLSASKNIAVNSPTPSISQPAQTRTCPRCGTPIASQASFCPTCGSSLNTTFKANAPATTTDTHVNNNRTSSQNTSSAHDDSAQDQTIVVRPQAKAQGQVQTYIPTTPKTQAHPFVVSPLTTDTTPTITNAQQQPAPTNPPSIPAASSTTMGSTPANSTGFTQRSKVILTVVVVVLVVLIALLILFIITHVNHGSNHTFHAVDIQVSYHARNRSLVTVFPAAPALAWLWTCGTSLASLADLT